MAQLLFDQTNSYDTIPLIDMHWQGMMDENGVLPSFVFTPNDLAVQNRKRLGSNVDTSWEIEERHVLEPLYCD